MQLRQEQNESTQYTSLYILIRKSSSLSCVVLGINVLLCVSLYGMVKQSGNSESLVGYDAFEQAFISITDKMTGFQTWCTSQKTATELE